MDTGKTCSIFITGAKSIGQYGGYETFLDHLIKEHKDHKNIQYYIVTKANGSDHMDEARLSGAVPLGRDTFLYHNARVKKLHVPQIGSAQAIYYDLAAFQYCLRYCKECAVSQPVFYILACRIGPWFGFLADKAHRLGGKVYVNPDGHEWKRMKWPVPVRKYWKLSEALMVRYADLIICDSVNIEKYICSEYSKYNPLTKYIAYGADTQPSEENIAEAQYREWMRSKGLTPGEYYICCGRFVPENSFEIMLREFMNSKTKRPFVLITNGNDRFYQKLERKLKFENDTRIRFVGTVYDRGLLMKIRENAFANLHGHTVGGTNPSLLEALNYTDVNLVIDVSFNREVAGDTALYWHQDSGDLARLIDWVDGMDRRERALIGEKAKERMRENYSWEKIARQYEELWEQGSEGI